MMAERIDCILIRGQDRLHNWGQWARCDGDRLSLPRQSAFAREYQPPAGETWDGEPHRLVFDPVDAELVEAIIRREWRHIHEVRRLVVKGFYVEHRRVREIARALHVAYVTVSQELDRAARIVGGR